MSLPAPHANRADAPPIGLIAGQGQLPLIVAQGIRAAGRRVACIGLRDQFSPELPQMCDDFAEAGVIQLGRWLRLSRRFGITEAVMVGRVAKARMHDPFRMFRQLPDWRAINLWYRKLRHDRRSATLLTVLADDLAKEGLVLIDSTTYIPDHMASEGVMTKRQPTDEQRGDIDFGWPLLKQVGSLDIGQAIAVRERCSHDRRRDDRVDGPGRRRLHRRRRRPRDPRRPACGACRGRPAGGRDRRRARCVKTPRKQGISVHPAPDGAGRFRLYFRLSSEEV